MYSLTNGVGVNQRNELMKGQRLMSYVPGDYFPRELTTSPALPEVSIRIRPFVTETVKRILREHADVWTELAKY